MAYKSRGRKTASRSTSSRRTGRSAGRSGYARTSRPSRARSVSGRSGTLRIEVVQTQGPSLSRPMADLIGKMVAPTPGKAKF